MTHRNWRATLFCMALILALTLACSPSTQPPTPTARSPLQPTRAPGGAQTPPSPSAPPSAGALDLGEAVSLTTATIGQAGGMLQVSSPGDTLDGLTIEVPAGAFADEVTLAVSSRQVEGHSLGPLFNPVSPLIEIRGAQALANELLTMTIPIEASADQFAMAFAYEAATGDLEGLALVGSSEDSVTVATRDISREVLVSVVQMDVLDTDVDTGFAHGVDDWAFANEGSYYAPGGHCAGQNISAMYYYIENLGPPLHGAYDNYDNRYQKTPHITWDDELGYRLASVAQKKLDWDGYGRRFWKAFNELVDDREIYNAFAYSMLLTGLPQYVGIYRTLEDGKTAGHALIAYRIEDHKLYVSDPNFPAGSKGGREERAITFDPARGVFEPYQSGATAADVGKEFDDIGYFGYRDVIDWDLMGELWQRLEDGRIGEDEFPPYELAVRQADSEAWDELWTNYESSGKDIVVRVRQTEFQPALEVLDASGKQIGASLEPVPIELQDGDNWLGFGIYGAVESGDKTWFRWVGFDWIKIIYQAPERPDPASLDLCDLLPPGGEGVRRGDFDCSQSYTHPGGFSSVQVMRIAVGSERACQQWQEGPFNTVIKTLNAGDCGYITAYTDPDSGNVIAGDGAAWTAFFAVGDFRVLVNSGTGAEYPARSDWVMDRVEEVQERLWELAGAGS